MTMADFSAQELAVGTDLGSGGATPDGAPAQELFSGGGGGPGITDYFKMRCRDSGLAPPGYVVWVVTGAPDDDASEAPLVGVASDIMVMASWQI